MAFKLSVVTDSDMHRCFEIASLAYGQEHPYFNKVYPHHETPSGRQIGATRMIATKNQDPNTTFLKVTDTSNDVIIAMAKWNIYKNNTIPEEVSLEGDFWTSDEEKEYAQLLFSEFLLPRRKAIRDSGGNVVSLDLLVVDPTYQRRGAGRMLVKWGTEIADSLGVETVVEASNYGRGLYEQEGFKELETWETRLPDKWQGKKEKQSFIWMIRPVKEVKVSPTHPSVFARIRGFFSSSNKKE